MPPAPHPAEAAPPPAVADDAPGYPECVPVLTDGVITIGAHRPDDADRIAEQCASPEMQRWVPVPRPYLPQHATEFLTRVQKGWLDPDGRREWAIRDPHGTYLGTIGLFDRSAGRCEVGFALHPDARGAGVMSRAVRLLAGWAFAQGVEVVQWRAEVGNWGSRRIAWACGFDTPTLVRGNGLDHAGRPRDMWHATLRHDEPLHPRAAWIHVPAVEGDRVRLREFREDDESFLPEARDARAARFLTRGLPTRDRYAAWLTEQRSGAAEGHTIHWALADRHTDEVLGAIVLTQLGHPRTAGTGMLGYWLLPQWRGRGLMTAGLDLTVATAFADPERASGGLGLRALRAVVDATNPESARVLRAAGFLACGRERAAYTHPDEPPADALVFDLLASDDRERQRVRPLVAPVIETERLRLRPWRASDRPHPADNPDEAALRFMPAGAQPGHDDFDAWLARKERFRDEACSLDWCIADRTTDQALGSVGLFHRGDGPIDFDAELGYWVFPSARGHGCVGEALPHVIAHAFRPRAEGGLGVTRVHAGADADNDASVAIMRRAGLREWGRDRQAWRRIDGTLTDGVYTELLAADPR